MLPPEVTDQLEHEIIDAKAAQSAYDGFVKQFCESKRQVLFEAFCSVTSQDVESLQEIRRMMSVIDALETEVKSAIETGRMATITLTQDKEKH